MLEKIIDRFSEWYKSDLHSKQEDAYSEEISSGKLELFSREEFIDFFFRFYIDGGKVQSGGNRHKNEFKTMVEQKFSDFRDFILEPFKAEFDINSWLSRLEAYPYFGQGIATIYLNRIDKKRYVIVNEKSIKAFTALGFEIKGDLIERYDLVLKAARYFSSRFPQLSNFYIVDALTHFLLGIDEGMQLLAEYRTELPAIYFHRFLLSVQEAENLTDLPAVGDWIVNHEYEEIRQLRAEIFIALRHPLENYEIDQIKNVLKKAKLLAGHASISAQLISVLNNPSFITTLRSFIHDMQIEHSQSRIDQFAQDCAAMGFKDADGKISYSAVALFTSVILTSLWPDRYVDYRAGRWRSLTEKFGMPYEFPNLDANSVGGSLLRAGEAAKFVSLFPDFQQAFANHLKTIPANWIVAGLAEMIYNGAFKHIQRHSLENDMILIPRHPLNQILYGPPGTGKTYSTIKLAVAIIEEKNTEDYEKVERTELRRLFEKYRQEKRIGFVTFHPSMGYEEFIEGIKPVPLEEGMGTMAVSYKIVPGIFQILAQKATENRNLKYVLIIDEINRGNVANIFGELITLIEKDKRADNAEALMVKLPYSQKDFTVPNNLYLIGTMNTADRSVEALDTALRRRFSFVNIKAQPELLAHIDCQGIRLDQMLHAINHRIEKLLDQDHHIGHSYFMINPLNELGLADLRIIFKDNIVPLLQEYFYGDYAKIGLVLGKDFIQRIDEQTQTRFMDFSHEFVDEFYEKPIYMITDVNNWTRNSFVRIYQQDSDEND